MSIQVSHYSGCGNSFIVLENIKLWFPVANHHLIHALCQNAGVDGLILVQKSAVADFQMAFFNSDGSEASMCGNGIRCMMRYLKDKIGFAKQNATIQAKERILHLSVSGDNISVDMGQVQELGFDIFLTFQDKEFIFHHLNSGVPHLVTVVEDVEAIDVAKTGAFFRSHPQFMPQGANVNFVQIINPSFCKIRTFERGVEAETLACGTGAVASAYALKKAYRLQVPMKLQVRSKEHLEIDITPKTCTMTGPAVCIRDGKLHFDTDTHTFSLEF
jgi:diaminopimelate epimerase